MTTFEMSRWLAPGALLMLSACGGALPPVDLPDSAIVERRTAPTAAEVARPTEVIMLGTGTPIPDARRAGPSVAVVHRGQAYLFDVGAGSVRNATIARYRYDIPSLYPSQICCVFLTHLHSDHTLDLAEAAYTLWWRRPRPLQVYGPGGVEQLVDGLQSMMAPDIAIRSSGTQPVEYPESASVDAYRVEPGTVYEADGIRIEAFAVSHGDIRPAFGYRIKTHDRTIVISGDTGYSETLEAMASGADVLIHEIVSSRGLDRNSPAFRAYHTRAHTPPDALGQLASRARPGLLVLYHGLYFGVPEEGIVEEVRAHYDGPVVLAEDLDRY